MTAVVSTRHGGVSTGVYDSLNLGGHVGDDPAAVAENRR
ncbi:MAG TPA: laccase domain-containing protein, partial [Trebonia sp.]|nr:laccase domain-containing protein [Trebonia sp.]